VAFIRSVVVGQGRDHVLDQHVAQAEPMAPA
jgi:hypothetical protein